MIGSRSAGDKRSPSPAADADTLTPNQFVARRIHELRLQRGLTLHAAAELVSPYLGKRWSTQAFSRAEQSAHGGNWIKPFNADEIQAFADAFGVTTTSFFAAAPPIAGHAHH